MESQMLTVSHSCCLRLSNRWPSNVESTRISIYSHVAWQSAIKVYGLEFLWIVAVHKKLAIACLPLVRQSSFLFGKRLVSLPWVDEAGAVSSPEAAAALIGHVGEMGRTSGAEVLIKQPLSSDSIADDAWHPVGQDKVLMRLRLTIDPEQLWKAISAKVRNQVRKAEKSGLVTESGGPELVKDFFEVYARNMRDLGSPSHSLKFFQTLVEELGDLAAVYCTRHEGVTVGGGIVLNNGASLDIPWASSRRDYNRMCVNHGMYWKILSDACEAGYEWFHFGRSSIGSGQYKFKKQWGAEGVPLNWWVYDPEEKSDSSVSPAAVREKFGLAQRLWTKLPLWASKRLGPLIIRYVP